jgi:hypothetical protein
MVNLLASPEKKRMEWNRNLAILIIGVFTNISARICCQPHILFVLNYLYTHSQAFDRCGQSSF